MLLLGIFFVATDGTMCPGVDSASKNEYQDTAGGKDGRCVRVTTPKAFQGLFKGEAEVSAVSSFRIKYPEDGGSTFVRKDGNFLQDCTSHVRRFIIL
jgi:hypothetical protein